LGSVHDGMCGISPWTAKHIAFAAENSTLNVDNVRVYGSRGPQTRITVGAADTCMMRHQSSLGSVAAKVKSIVLDHANKFSSLEEKRVKVDYTPPTMTDLLKVNTRMENSEVQNVTISWPRSVDPHSDVKRYEYTVAHSNLNNNAFRHVWRDLGLAASVQLSLDCQQIPNTVILVRAENHAGLKSSVAQHVLSCRCGSPTLAKQFSVFPNPVRDELVVQATAHEAGRSHPDEARIVRLYDLTGRVLQETTLEQRRKLSMEAYPSGIYMLRILQGGRTAWCEKIVKIGY